MMKNVLSLQISWSVVAYFRRKAVETSMKASECDSKAKRIIVPTRITCLSILFEQHENWEPSKNIFQISCCILVVYTLLETWKFMVDVILPMIWPAYDRFIGKVEDRSLTQRLMWIFLLQVFHLSVEASALYNYFKLRSLVKKHKKHVAFSCLNQAVTATVPTAAATQSIPTSKRRQSVFSIFLRYVILTW